MKYGFVSHTQNHTPYLHKFLKCHGTFIFFRYRSKHLDDIGGLHYKTKGSTGRAEFLGVDVAVAISIEKIEGFMTLF